MLLMLALLAASAPTDGLDRLFAGVDRRDTPGCAVDIRRGPAVVAKRAYGLANLETDTSVSMDTVFEAGSASKQFIGAGVAYLAASGALSLDDPVRRWIPELPPLYRDVTLRMLLNHTSGVRNWNNFAELTGLPEGARTYDQAWALRALIRQTALNNPPGAEYLYSNSNFVLAAVVVQRAAGGSLQEFYRRAFFEPLGMTRTRWRTDHRDVVPSRAQAYSLGDDGRWRLDMPFNDVVGPGGLLTTVGDLQRWNAALADPRPQDRAWVAAMTVPGRLSDGTPTRYGLGLELDDVAGAQAVAHAGATAGYRSWLGRFPQTGLSVAILCNAGSLDTEELGPAVAALYLPAPVGRTAAPAVQGSPPAGVQGLFRNAASDALVRVTADGGGIRFGGGALFTARSDTVLVTLDGRRSAALKRRSDGAVEAIRLTRETNSPVELERVEAWAPSAAELAAFQGVFRSRDFDGDQGFHVEAGSLVWIDPAGGRQLLKAAYVDAFSAPDSGWTLRFHRQNGRVTSVDMSIGRARRIRFEQVLGR